jgi:hypothetical protein
MGNVAQSHLALLAQHRLVTRGTKRTAQPDQQRRYLLVPACPWFAPEAWPAWLAEEQADEAQLKALLAPYPSEDMVCWPGQPPRRQRQEQRSHFGGADCGYLMHR